MEPYGTANDKPVRTCCRTASIGSRRRPLVRRWCAARGALHAPAESDGLARGHRHVGTFCMSSTSKPLPIRGTQLFTSDPPGFVWSARVQMFPGLWVDARYMAA